MKQTRKFNDVVQEYRRTHPFLYAYILVKLLIIDPPNETAIKDPFINDIYF